MWKASGTVEASGRAAPSFSLFEAVWSTSLSATLIPVSGTDRSSPTVNVNAVPAGKKAAPAESPTSVKMGCSLAAADSALATKWWNNT